MATTDNERRTVAARNLSRLPSLTGMRWVAAFLVFVFHLSYVGGPVGAAVGTVVGRAGYLGVTFFFILSGFVLTYSARPADTARKFWRRRVAKIFPNHWATFLLAGVLLVVTGQAFGVGDAILNLFLVQDWVPRMSAWISMNSVSWSLSCELLFYLLFPLLLRLIRRIPEHRLWLALGVVVGLILATPFVIQFAVPGTPRIPFSSFGPVSYTQLWLVYFFPPVRGLEFVLGIVVARLVMSGRWVRVGMLPAASLVVVGQVVALSTASSFYLLSVSAVPSLPAALLIAAGATADINGAPSPYRGRTMVYLGEISFAFYMVHEIVVTYAQGAFSGGAAWNAPMPLSRWLLFSVVALAIAVGLAALLYKYVEAPSLRRFSRSKADRVPVVR